MPVTRPSSSPRKRTGLVSSRNSTPSSSAWWTSSARAGISSWSGGRRCRRSRRPGAGPCGRSPWPRCRRRSGHVLALDDGRVVLGEGIGLHQVGAGQVLVGGIDADEVLAGNLHEDGQAGADAEEDGVELLQQFVHGITAADDRVDFDLAPQAFQEVTFLGHDGLGQAEFGDAVDQHAARPVQGLEDGDFMALLDQVAGHGEAGGTGADHGHLLPGGLGLGRQDVFAVLRS